MAAAPSIQINTAHPYGKVDLGDELTKLIETLTAENLNLRLQSEAASSSKEIELNALKADHENSLGLARADNEKIVSELSLASRDNENLSSENRVMGERVSLLMKEFAKAMKEVRGIEEEVKELKGSLIKRVVDAKQKEVGVGEEGKGVSVCVEVDKSLRGGRLRSFVSKVIRSFLEVFGRGRRTVV